MAIKLFLDTNILLDFILKRKGELPSIEMIFNAADKEELEIYISESVIATANYILQKERMDALPILRELCKTIKILKFDKNILYMPIDKYVDIEDGLLYFLSVHSKMNYFITRNNKDFVYTLPALPVNSPVDFINNIYLLNDL